MQFDSNSNQTALFRATMFSKKRDDIVLNTCNAIIIKQIKVNVKFYSATKATYISNNTISL
jgi:hypothetical protein